jgi:hypothetical protein
VTGCAAPAEREPEVAAEREPEVAAEREPEATVVPALTAAAGDSSARRRDTAVHVKNLAVDECSGGTQQESDGIRHIVFVPQSP